MDPMAAIRETFFVECEEQLGELERGLVALENGTAEADTINAVFRAVHSIKGGGGIFALEDLVRFAHVFETSLDGLRSGTIEVDSAATAIMLRAADVLADLVRAARDGSGHDHGRVASASAELAALTGAATAQAPAPVDDLDDIVFERVQLDTTPTPAPATPAPLPEARRTWVIRFTPRAEMYAHANEPGLILRELARLGTIDVRLDADALPALDALDPEGAYFSWTIHIETECDRAQIRQAFEWVEDHCALDIDEATDPSAPPATDTDEGLRALLARISQEAAEAPAAAPPAGAPIPAPPALPSASASPVAVTDKRAEQATTIRVDLQRIDRLANLVGELVINEAMLTQHLTAAGLARAAGLANTMESLSQLTREIQHSVMAIRAQPVRSVFQRMPRLVREVAAMTGKTVRLICEGEETEIDKTVIERLSDPLTHMIRNAIDHGLETAQTRIEHGKPAEGTVRLSAIHRSGKIVIEVSDDGAGLDRARIRAKAVEKGLIAADAPLTDDETDNLIFMPGFSTAATLSDISGRGVGLDVVKQSIHSLGGRISIASQPGRGSTFTLSLPLTLAVLDGMVVSVAGHVLVVPLGPIVETLRPAPGQTHRLGAQSRVMALRGGYIPIVDTGVLLGFRGQDETPEQVVALLVEGENGDRIILEVDELQGQRQIVIKSLEANYGAVDGISAATVMGDGRVALIVDVDALIAASRAEIPAAGRSPTPRHEPETLLTR
ncbi:two-component system chemotaxis sensor kinase CheA [Endobacter medicaginis]|uniref:Chemotaxis protein CheA n=2 Tax=Endobacter medicaginis TaxID=1181271 RepID=A0A839UWG5_9PROT|nr:two-component system chemotaxis sensor kinase CheA [Endobacter medicaginis]NVN29262.1 chemotaxis protein CheA [Endobacter medicaginis]